MKDQYQFKIIDNVLPAAEAGEVLKSLFIDKIRFLEHKIFGLEERFGKNCDDIRERIAELYTAKREIMALVKEMEGKSFEINCDIDIKVTAPKVAAPVPV